MNDKIVIWKCKDCGKLNWSNPFRHHQMDTCECGKSGMDLETYGCRTMGNVEIIKKIQSFFNEIVIGMQEQGYYGLDYFVRMDNKVYITMKTVLIIREIEDDIIKKIIEGLKDE